MPRAWARKLVSRLSKKNVAEDLVYYVPASLSLKKSSLVHALSKRVNGIQSNLSSQNVDSQKRELGHRFISFCGVLESYMLLHEHKQAKALMNIYNNIDPDKFHQNPDEKTDLGFLRMMEKSFLSYFSYCLTQAGYHEVPRKALKEILDAHVKYGDIQVSSKCNMINTVILYQCFVVVLDSRIFQFCPIFSIDPPMFSQGNAQSYKSRAVLLFTSLKSMQTITST